MANEIFHLHLETFRNRPQHFHLTEALWRAAAERHPDLARQLRVTIGWDGDILDESLKTADFMINSFPPREGLRERAPRLKWIQTTGAGVDALLPLDWLPSGITLTNNRGAHGRKAEDSCALALLALHTRLPETLQHQRDRVWKQILTSPDSRQDRGRRRLRRPRDRARAAQRPSWACASLRSPAAARPVRPLRKSSRSSASTKRCHSPTFSS